MTTANYVNDLINSFVQTSGTKTTGYSYGYIPAGQTNAGKLQFVTLQVDGSNVRRCQYDYYGSNEPYGLLGDLKRVTVQEWAGSSWTPSGTSYYRYYKTDVAPGFAHGLLYIVGKQSYAMMTARGITPEIALPEQIAQYADNYFEYDNPTSRQAVLERVGGGTLTFNYNRSSNPVPNPNPNSDFNYWETKAVEVLPDGHKQYVYTNSAAQVMLKVFVKVANQQETGDKWFTYFKYDASARDILKAESSAVLSYLEASPTLELVPNAESKAGPLWGLREANLKPLGLGLEPKNACYNSLLEGATPGRGRRRLGPDQVQLAPV